MPYYRILSIVTTHQGCSQTVLEYENRSDAETAYSRMVETVLPYGYGSWTVVRLY